MIITQIQANGLKYNSSLLVKTVDGSLCLFPPQEPNQSHLCWNQSEAVSLPLSLPCMTWHHIFVNWTWYYAFLLGICTCLSPNPNLFCLLCFLFTLALECTSVWASFQMSFKVHWAKLVVIQVVDISCFSYFCHIVMANIMISKQKHIYKCRSLVYYIFCKFKIMRQLETFLFNGSGITALNIIWVHNPSGHFRFFEVTFLVSEHLAHSSCYSGGLLWARHWRRWNMHRGPKVIL